MIERRYALSLGSNLGERMKFLRGAVHDLGSLGHDIQCSRIYQSAPMYVTEQPMFLNMAVTMRSTCQVEEFLQRLKELERLLGRLPSVRRGPRVVDIDIILCGDCLMDCAALTIPHRLFRERAFVLIPLSEIAGDWIDPVTGKTIAVLCHSVPCNDVMVYSSTM